MYRNLWRSASVAALAAATFAPCQAWAQAQDSAAPGAESGQVADSEAEASDADIVVTALRRDQSLQKAPAAITLVSGDQLQRQQIFDIRGVQNLVPGARFSANNSATRVYIRGVGSALDFYWIPETTAINLNGVYIPRFATVGGFFDIDSIQVLPGPQGVLYGKSAGGGAVVINTNRPVNRSEASGLLELGNYNQLHVEAMGNVPLTDNLAVRAAFNVNRHDGYQSFGLDASDSFSARLSALWKPTDDLSVFLWGQYASQQGTPTGAQYLPYLSGHDPWYIPANDPVTGADNTRGSRKNFQYGIGGIELKYDLGSVTLEYNGSILRQTDKSLHKLVGNDQVIDNAQTQYTQSFHVSGTSGDLDWVGGVDWLYAKSRFDTRFGPRQFGAIGPDIRNRSISAFGQGTYSVTPGLRLVAGARATRDSLVFKGYSNACFAVCIQSPINFDQSWKHVDVKGGVEVDLAPKVMAYANIQTGYAPGTLNTFADRIGINKEIKPQTLLAYTGGVKSSLGNGLLTLNLEGFYYDYKKLIIQAFNASLGQQTLYNAPSAKIYGLQAMMTIQPTRNDTITANVAYTHSAYGNFVPSPGQRDLGGLQLAFSPTWTGTVAYDRRFDLANGGRIDARISAYLSSSYWGTFDHSADAFQKSYTRSDASVTYRPAGEAWSLAAWIKNIENTAVNSAMSSSGYPAPFAGATGLEPPRTYGVSLGFKL